MRPPLVCAEGLDVHVFDSASDLIAWVEAIDVKEGAYECYDSEGRQLDLLVSGADQVFIEERTVEDAGVEALAKLLRESLASGRVTIDSRGMDLTSLIEAARRRR